MQIYMYHEHDHMTMSMSMSMHAPVARANLLPNAVRA